MIKLIRSFCPIRLTPDFVKVKTEEYKRTKKSVWNIEWLKDDLKKLSYGKCAYCECDLSKGSSYMEVEHFEDKHHNEDKVMQWDNLLPSCKHCNVHKSDHDVIAEPIVNPFVDNPKDHLYLQCYRYKPKDEKGRTTIDVLQLNDNERKMVYTRFDLGNKLQELILSNIEKLKTYSQNASVINRNKLKNSVNAMLQLCQPESEFSATCATVLHSSVEYLELKTKMKHIGLWSQELERMDIKSSELCLFE